MAILLTGGAGYIGSHCLQYLLEQKEEVIVVDNLQTGHKQALLNHPMIRADLRDLDSLLKIFRQNKIEAVIHFAANSLVGESMQNPYLYYDNNIGGTLTLLKAMQENNVKKIVFSSTAATYGQPIHTPIEETDPTNPTNVYGETKRTMEKMMAWFDEIHQIRHVALRYFNAAGAHSNADIGESHQPETHLIPLVLQTALGKRDHISIFGNDYPTKDGTCIRDYVHVMDLAKAHYQALIYLRNNNPSTICNLGSQTGFSVQEIIDMAKKITGKSINYQIESRRLGDPAILIASNKKAKKELGWEPSSSSIEQIIADAWAFHLKYPNGFSKC